MIQADRTRRWFFRFRAVWFHIFNSLCLLVVIILTGSRGAALAAIGSMSLVVLKSKHFIIIGFIMLLTVFAGWYSLPDAVQERFVNTGSTSDETGQKRLTLWRAGIDIFSQNPIFGVGIGNFISEGQKIDFSIDQVPHNIFIECLSQSGILAFLTLMLIFITYFRINHNTRRNIEAKNDVLWIRFLSHGLDVGIVGFFDFRHVHNHIILSIPVD